MTDLKYINLRAQRKKDKHSETDPWEKTQLRALLGGISWHAQQVAPHFSAEVSFLLSEMNHSTIDTVLRCNKLLDKVKDMKDHHMRIHSIPLMSFICMFGWMPVHRTDRMGQVLRELWWPLPLTNCSKVNVRMLASSLRIPKRLIVNVGVRVQLKRWLFNYGFPKRVRQT